MVGESWNIFGCGSAADALFRTEDEEMIPGVEDFRNTLLWLPRAQTDDNGEFTVEFPTSDISSTFRISGIILTPDVRKASAINEYFKVK